MDLYGSQWNSEVSACYVRLADYKKELALKYVSKQGKLVKLNGETEELAKKALEEYINAPVNHSANNAIGGRWQNYSSEAGAMERYSKKRVYP